MALFKQVTMSDGSVHGNGLRWVEWYWILIQTPLEVKAQMTPFFFFILCIDSLRQTLMTPCLFSWLNSNGVSSKHLEEDELCLVSIGASSPFGKNKYCTD